MPKRKTHCSHEWLREKIAPRPDGKKTPLLRFCTCCYDLLHLLNHHCIVMDLSVEHYIDWVAEASDLRPCPLGVVCENPNLSLVVLGQGI